MTHLERIRWAGLSIVLVAFATASAAGPTTRPQAEAAPATQPEAARSAVLLAAIMPDLVLPRPSMEAADQLPEQASELLAEAGTLVDQKRSVLAIVKLEKALSYAPKSRDIHRMLGRVHFQTGNYAKAELHLTRALAFDPNDQEARYWLGEAQAGLGRPADALRSFLLAARSKPAADESSTAIRLPYALGRQLDEQGYTAAALGLLEQVAARAEPGKLSAAQKADAEVFALAGAGRTELAARIARLKVAAGQTGEGIGALEALVASGKADRSTLVSLTSAYVTEGDQDKAAATLVRLAKDCPLADADGLAKELTAKLGSPAALRKVTEKALAGGDLKLASPTLVLVAALAARGCDAPQQACKLLADYVKAAPAADVRIYAQLLDWTAAPASAAGVWRDAIAANPAEPATGLADRLLANTKPPAAGEVAGQFAGRDDFASAYVAGRFYAAAGQADKAAASFAKAVAAKKDFAAGYAALMRLRLAAGQPDEALKVLGQAESANVAAGDLHLLAGRAQMAKGDIDAAIDQFRQAEAIDRDNVEYALELADAYLAGDQPAAAVRRLRRVYEAHPDNTAAMARLARYHEREQQWDEAALYAKKLLDVQPGNVEAARIRGIALVRQGGRGVREGARMIEEAAKKNPDSAQAQFGLGQLERLRSPGDPGKAIGLLKRAVELDGELLAARRELADALKENQQFGEALVQYRFLHTRRPGDDLVTANLVTMLLRMGELDEADKALRASRFERVELRVKLGTALAEEAISAGKRDLALRVLDDLLAQELSEESRKEITQRRIELLTEAGQKDEAVKLARELYQANPASAELTRFYLGVLLRAERFDDALALLDEKLAQAGGDAERLNLSLQKVAVLQLARRMDDAVKVMEAVHRDRPDNAMLAQQYVRLLSAAGKHAQAAKDAKALLDADPENEDLANLYMAVLLRGERFDEALAVLEARLAKAEGEDAQVELGLEKVSILRLAERDDAALKAAEALYRAHADSEDVVELYVRLLIDLKKPADALAVLDKRGGGADESEPLLVLRMEALARLGRMDEFEKATARLLDRVPPAKLGEAWHMISNIHAAAGRVADARKALAKALEVEPENPGANNDLGYQLADEGIELDRAERMIRVALAARPNVSAYIDSMAWVLYKKAKWAEAARLLARAVAEDDDPDPIILDHYGDVLYRLGEKDKALAQWKASAEARQKRKDDEPAVDSSTLAKTLKKIEAIEGNKSEVPVAPLGKGVAPQGGAGI